MSTRERNNAVDSFVSRQPIFTRDRRVYGYELLFRSGLDSFAGLEDGDAATRQMMADSYGLLGIDALVHGKKAFIRVPNELLLDDWVTLLRPDEFVIEISGALEPNEDVVGACQRLRDAGYTLALDAVSYEQRDHPLARLVQMFKVDALTTAGPERSALVEHFRPLGIDLLAGKVETHGAFNEAHRAGFQYFQGYFFCGPVMLGEKRPRPIHVHCLELLRELHRPATDLWRIEELVKRDVSITYRLLRYINSAYFGLRQRVHSVRHALNLLGETESRRWLSLIAVASVAEEKPLELMLQATARARLCELLAAPAGLGERAEELFLVGLFSLLDAILDQPLAEILERVALGLEIERALLGDANPLRDVLDLAVAYERAEWGRLSELSQRLSVGEFVLPPLYRDALDWSERDQAGEAAA